MFASGPSLNKLNAEKVKEYLLQGFDLLAINSYVLSEFAKIAPPTLYLLSDPVHFGKLLHMVIPEKREEVSRVFDLVSSLNIPLFCPIEFYKLSYDKVYYYNTYSDYFSNNVSDLTKPHGFLGMTAYRALSAAVYMGYDVIYICGYDNDWFKSIKIDDNNEIFYTNKHYYNITGHNLKVKGTDSNSLGELLYQYHFLFKHLEKFKNYNIYNLDKDSLVDAFSKHHNLDIY